MKITCQTEELKKTLQAVQRAVASKGILPVLSNVLLTTEQESGRFLRLVGTDLEIGIEARLEAELDEAVHTTLPAKKWFEIVNKFPDQEITLEFKADGTVSLLGQKLNFHLNTLPADDFPRLPQVQRDKVIELNLLEFCQAIRQTCFAAATDSAKTILTGVNVQIQAGQLKLAATDGYRLAVRHLTLPQDSPTASAIIPRRSLLELEKLVKQDEQETLLMSLTDNHVLFESQDKILTSRLIEGKYPDYNKILPKQFERRIWVETRPFLSAVERVSIMASEQTHVVSFAVKGSTLTISAGAEQGRAQEEVDIKTEGEPLTISFNAQYLIEVLRTYAEDASHILLQLNSEVQPVVVSAVDNDDYLCMLMPIKP